jgi:carotenoid cleavage dioxygenase-like enzyme
MTSTVPASAKPPSNFAPIDFETELGPLPVEGVVPPALRGTLLRNGPNPVVPDPHGHLFSGDGMLHAFHVEGGEVRYENRWVRTTRYEYARRTGQSFPAGLGAPRPEAEREADDTGTANTSVIRHAGRVLALEEAHLPVAVDLATLATLGVETFDGGLVHRFTAHPKVDPETGELLFFAYGTPASFGAGMSFGVVSPAGAVTRFERFEAPYASMVHDFAVTKGHVVFPVMPLTASEARLRAGRPVYAWEPSYGTRVGVMPRGGSVADMQWWSAPPCYVFHVMNAWDADGRLFIDVMQFEKPPLFPNPDGTPAGGLDEPAHLVRWEIALDDPQREVRRTRLAEVTGEFPRIDERRAGLPYRHGWFAGNARGEDGRLRSRASVVHVDHEAPRADADVYTFAGGARVSEPVFVPRSADAEEGDGWVLATVLRPATGTSDLVAFDARAVAAGPVGSAKLPHRVPDGFHGNWFGAEQGVRS